MSYVSTCLADGAVGLWELAETGGTTATDQAGNSNGTYNGAVTLANFFGIPGTAPLKAVVPTTSSINNNVSIPSVASNQLGDTFTMEIWVKRTATQGAVQRIMGNLGSSGLQQLGFNASNQLQVGKQGTANIVASTSAITDTTSWHHLVWTKATSTNHLYIDGVDVTGSVSNQSMTTNIGGWQIMMDHSNVSAPPAGMGFAMAAIYPTALTSTVVANHYSLGSTGTPPSNSVAPVVSGTPVVAQVLSTTNGTWSDDGTGSLGYQWQRDNLGGGSYSAISGATLTNYTLQSNDYACKIRCVVTDTEASGNGSASANSNAVGPVTARQRVGIPIFS